jgi:hypothetical protein
VLLVPQAKITANCFNILINHKGGLLCLAQLRLYVIPTLYVLLLLIVLSSNNNTNGNTVVFVKLVVLLNSNHPEIIILLNWV